MRIKVIHLILVVLVFTVCVFLYFYREIALQLLSNLLDQKNIGFDMNQNEPGTFTLDELPELPPSVELDLSGRIVASPDPSPSTASPTTTLNLPN